MGVADQMGTSAKTTLFLNPSTQLKQPKVVELRRSSVSFLRRSRRRPLPVVARLFGPAVFEAAKLDVVLQVEQVKGRPEPLPRTYTLTHSDLTAKLTLAISQSINRTQFQSWYNRFYRDEVVAEWKKVKGKMSLHVHCHISGGHFLLDFLARLRYYIFSRELPVVLKAFVHGDIDLFRSQPELDNSLVWVYFHSNIPEFDRLECWGPLRDAMTDRSPRHVVVADAGSDRGDNFLSGRPQPTLPQQCSVGCSCCYPRRSSIPWAQEFHARRRQQETAGFSPIHHQQQRQ